MRPTDHYDQQSARSFPSVLNCSEASLRHWLLLASKVLWRLFWLPTSYLLGQLLANGLQFMTFSAEADFVFNVLVGACIYAVVWVRTEMGEKFTIEP